MSTIIETFSNGKYRVTFNDETGEFFAERYGEKWRSLAGDKLVLSMFQDVHALKKFFSGICMFCKKAVLENGYSINDGITSQHKDCIGRDIPEGRYEQPCFCPCNIFAMEEEIKKLNTQIYL